jgi:hypothetical protein
MVGVNRVAFRTLLAALLTCAACSRSQPIAPSAVTPAPTTTPPLVLTGQVTATVAGQALPGVSLDLAGNTTTTDGSGAFRFELPQSMSGTNPRLMLTGSGILERSLTLSLFGPRAVSLDAIALDGGFDLNYYRRLVRDTYDFPDIVRTLRRWTQAPVIYLKTVDESGQPMDPATLDAVAAALSDDATAWTGGRFGIAGIQRGTESREGVSGWITVKWPTTTGTTTCGRAQIATDGGWIELDYLTVGCSCQGLRISPGVVRHELGHAMGFFHTNEPDDVMYQFAQCDRRRPDHPGVDV